ncbi:hypothetical protein HNY73_020095 [Argiope bruennichi]|uniref:Uncharacterized protein n=1 Tax=Argiope bruennichi TaxID=94029 RepID=A0A8T0E898_ARGBR|nr:hypothetical protein HNY73_020095 [Argiope bruennichi]
MEMKRMSLIVTNILSTGNSHYSTFLLLQECYGLLSEEGNICSRCRSGSLCAGNDCCDGSSSSSSQERPEYGRAFNSHWNPRQGSSKGRWRPSQTPHPYSSLHPHAPSPRLKNGTL